MILRRVSRRSWAALGALGLLSLSVIAAYSNAPGEVIADARYEHSADPGQFLARHASVWDDERNLGAPTQFFSPVLPVFQTAVQQTGAAPWVIQRATHALLFTFAGVGAMLFARQFSGAVWTWTLAGFIYAFNPYTSQALLPSGLFMAYVAAPWMAMAVHRGLQAGADRWRWAAVFALSVFCLGSLNTPSVVLALLPSLGLLIASLVSDRSSWRWAVGLGWRVAMLTSLAAAAMLTVVGLNRDVVRINLLTTETPQSVAASSSASETWRGLGNWLSYLHVGGGQLRDQAALYFTNELVIVCTFLAAVVAGYALVWSRDRRLASLGVIAGVSVVVMVGIYPADTPAPFARALEAAFDESLFFRGFRNLYKAGPGLQLPLAVLAAAGLGTAMSQVGVARKHVAAVGKPLLGGVVAAGLIVASWPFWSGGLYPSSTRHEGIPTYWTEAFAWFDTQPAHDGVLILPSAARTTYRWGVLNDTLFDAYLKQPAVSARTLPQSTRVLADLTEAVDDYARGGSVEPGTLAPILRRMGVRWVLLQNDLDWFFGALPRPSTYDFIRDDPDFSLARAFGTPGENVVGPVSLDRRSAREGELPPVEIYELNALESAAAVKTDSLIVVEGAGDSWPGLSDAGWLEHGVVYAGDLSAAEQQRLLRTARAFVVTDGAQRRAQRVFFSQSWRSPVLGLYDDVGREPLGIHENDWSQTVADHGAVRAVSASHFGRVLSVWDFAWQPSNAFDSDPDTAWATELSGVQSLALQLEPDTVLRSIELQLFSESEDGLGLADVFENLYVVVVDDAGRRKIVAPETLSETLEIQLDDSAVVTDLEVMVERRVEVAGMVGLAEIRLTGEEAVLDTRTALRVPGPADASAEVLLIEALQHTPTHHVFRRLIGPDRQPEETGVRREFWTPGGPTDVVADVRISGATPDASIDFLVGAEVSAVGSTRYEGLPRGTARNLLDGKISTAWQFERGEAATASVSIPAAEVDELQIWLVAGGGALPFELSRVEELTVRVVDSAGASTSETFRLGKEPECDPAFSGLGEDVCIERLVLPIEPTIVTDVVIETVAVDGANALFSRPPVQVAELLLLREGAAALDPSALEPSTDCRDLITAAGATLPMRPVGVPTVDALQRGVQFRSCEPLELQAGWHQLATSPVASHAVAGVQLGPAGSEPPGVASADPLTTRRDTASDRQFGASVDVGDVVITNVPFHQGWQVATGGVDGERIAVDGFVAWVAGEQGEVDLDVRFGPQRRYRWAWFVSAATVAACLWLVVPAARRRRP